MIDKVYSRVSTFSLLTLLFVISGCGLDLNTRQYSTSEDLSSPVECTLDRSSAPKNVALLHFDLNKPQQSQYFPNIQQFYSEQLLRKIRLEGRQRIQDVRHITLKPQEISLLGQIYPDSSAQIREIGRQFDSQLVLYGRFSDISQSQQFNVLDKIAEKSQFTLGVTLYIFDGVSGQLIHTSSSTHTATRESDFITHKANSRHNDEIKREVVNTIIAKQLDELNKVASCTPLMGRVILADNINATINLGTQSRINQWKLFDLYRSELQHTDARGIEHLVKRKVATLRITRVMDNSAMGRIEALSATAEVQIGDQAIGR